MTDTSLRRDVIDELDFDPKVNSAHIGVAVENGVVTLSGHVGSCAEKLAVEKAVKRVRGVRAIAEGIEVRHAGEKRTADDEIAGRAANILRWSDVVPPDSVTIKVQDGRVLLSGEVDWNYQRRAAEAWIRRLSGVVGVMNAITIKSRLQPADIKQKIEAALKRHAEIEAEGIRVTILDGNRVSLAGEVRDWRERDAVHQAVWSAAGISGLEDHLRIAL